MDNHQQHESIWMILGLLVWVTEAEHNLQLGVVNYPYEGLIEEYHTEDTTYCASTSDITNICDKWFRFSSLVTLFT